MDRRLTPARWRLDPSAAPLPAHPLAFDSDEQARTWFVAECTNLIAAAHTAADAALHTLAWQLPAACNGLFDNRGHLPDWLSTLQRALAATQALGEGRGETYTRVNLSHVLMRLRRFDEAAEQARSAVATAQRTADLPGQAHALGYRAWSHHYAGDFAKAAECHLRSRQLFLELGDSWAATVALTDLAEAYRALGRLDDALDGHRRALEIFRELGDRHREGWTLWQLGNDHQAAGRFDAALEYHSRALETARTQIGNRQLEARALDEIGADLHLRDRAGARAHWQAALTLYEQLGDPAADDVRTKLHTA